MSLFNELRRPPRAKNFFLPPGRENADRRGGRNAPQEAGRQRLLEDWFCHAQKTLAEASVFDKFFVRKLKRAPNTPAVGRPSSGRLRRPPSPKGRRGRRLTPLPARSAAPAPHTTRCGRRRFVRARRR